ncbi:hypothetical protein B9G69_012095 [Bdellovibrio sp. SKB1291214]|uniref:hypothetical protein n=1 Tax=Bdellovibrio sp. SKB1291214 TaxID=1732569 RepID=UPI001130B74E|nr:hypothetical protein [Bdellovibrio sp. SKB1291214]UYL07787.1 hypothetical protein B9G69_012095 [Bdellovibrio sp. SKB1291214]
MEISKFLIAFIFTLAVSSAHAVDSCSAVFGSESPIHTFISEYRQAHIQSVDSTMPVSEAGYKIIGKLGQSTAKVYLALEPSTQASVVVKMNSTIPMFWRELMVTDYLISMGETVPKILKAYLKEDGTTVIVREYFKGLTGHELKKERSLGNKDLPQELATTGWHSLDAERKRLDDLFSFGGQGRPSFSTWYKSNASRLESKYRDSWNRIAEMKSQDPKLNYDIYDILYVQDFHKGNFLYEIQRNRWVVFDP